MDLIDGSAWPVIFSDPRSSSWRLRSCCGLLAVLLAACAAKPSAPAPPRFEENRGVATDSQVLSVVDIARRLLTPLTFRRILPRLATLPSAPLNVANERFFIDVPDSPPPVAGYGLLVFIPPWEDATIPDGWAEVLHHRQFVYVSAANSGNAANVIDRRVPLALAGYETVRRTFRIDPARIYVAGMSGGSRVALRVALAYADIFRGALLNAGSDPIGEQGLVAPPLDLLSRFQEHSHLVYLTGELDETRRQMDRVSESSMHDWCLANLHDQVIPRLGHETAPAAALNRALEVLDSDENMEDRSEMEHCRAKLNSSLAKAVDNAYSELKRGDRTAAQSKIQEIDRRFGGLSSEAVNGLEDARLSK